MSYKSYEVPVTIPTEGKEELNKDIDIESDEDIILSQKVDMRIEEAKPLHNKVCETAEDSMKIFRGKIEEIAGVKANQFQDKSVLSRVFFTVRNMVGLATDSMPVVEIVPDNDNPKSIKRAKSIEANIDWLMLDNDFQGKLSKALFDAWIKSDCFFHWYWDYDRDDVGIDIVGIEDISISSEATGIQDAEYVVYHPDRSRTWWKENYPEVYKKGNIKFVHKTNEGISETDKSDRGNVAKFIRYMENDVWVEKVASKDGEPIILRKVKNPYFEYRTEEEQQADFSSAVQAHAQEQENTLLKKLKGGAQRMLGMEQPHPEGMEFVPIANYLIKARKPFVQLPSIKLEGELYSEAVTQHVREVFLSMNAKKRAYADNLRGCNQKIIVDKDSLTKEEARKITDEPNQVIRVSFQDNAKPFYIEKGGEVPASFHNDIAHDEAYIDDLFGNHEISRGAGNSGTLGQDQMNAQSDRTPIRFQSRATERAIVELTEGMLQLMRLFYTKTHYAKKFGNKEGVEIIELINEDIEEGVKPHIKPGSMVDVTKEEKAARAVQMFSQGALDPYTMFVDLGVPNPAELADRLVNWINAGMISADDPETLMADKNAINPAMQTVERANQENEAIQQGDNVPPTPAEFISEDHVKMHYAFLGDKNVKLEDDDRDILLAHAEVDKASLTRLMAEGMARGAGQEQGQAPTQPEQKPQ